MDLRCTKSLTTKGDHASILASCVVRPADIATNIIRVEWCYDQYFSRDTIDNCAALEVQVKIKTVNHFVFQGEVSNKHFLVVSVQGLKAEMFARQCHYNSLFSTLGINTILEVLIGPCVSTF